RGRAVRRRAKGNADVGVTNHRVTEDTERNRAESKRVVGESDPRRRKAVEAAMEVHRELGPTLFPFSVFSVTRWFLAPLLLIIAATTPSASPDGAPGLGRIARVLQDNRSPV